MLSVRRCFGLGALAVALLGLQGCGVSTAKPKAEAAVAAFHRQLDAGQFDAIWDGADESFRNATAHEKYAAFVGAVHRKLGQVVKTTTANWSVRNYNLQTSVVLLQQTEFEHGSGTETFTYLVKGDAVKLVGYNIQSTELVTL